MWTEFRYRGLVMNRYQYDNYKEHFAYSVIGSLPGWLPYSDYENLKIGSNVDIDRNVHIGYHKIQEPRIKDFDEKVVIGDDCIIRDGVIIYIGCKIGKGTMIGHHTIIREATEFGEYCRIGHGSSFCGADTIGHHTSIHDQVHITAHSKIGCYVFIGPMVVTTNDFFMSYKRKTIEPNEFKGVTILDGARIGAGCVICPGITIGREAKIGAGALITKDISDYAVAIGSPAKMIAVVPENELLKNNGVEI